MVELLEDRTLLSAGSLDTSFSDDGKVTTNVGQLLVSTDFGRDSVAYQSDGKVLVVGETAINTFAYTVSDGTASDTGTVTITITGENDAPSANSDTYEARESSGVSVLTDSLLSNDTDPDASDVLSVTAIDSTGTIGLVTFVDGVVRYDLNGQFESLAAGETAIDTFAYTVSDGTAFDTATVTFTITGENDAPTVNAVAGAVVIDEGRIAANTGTFDDIDSSDEVRQLARNNIPLIELVTGARGQKSEVRDQLNSPLF